MKDINSLIQSRQNLTKLSNSNPLSITPINFFVTKWMSGWMLVANNIFWWKFCEQIYVQAVGYILKKSITYTSLMRWVWKKPSQSGLCREVYWSSHCVILDSFPCCFHCWLKLLSQIMKYKQYWLWLRHFNHFRYSISLVKGGGCIWAFSKEWRRLFNQYKHKSQFKQLSPNDWLCQILLKLWEFSWNLWKYRNGIVHYLEKVKLLQEVAAKI